MRILSGNRVIKIKTQKEIERDEALKMLKSLKKRKEPVSIKNIEQRLSLIEKYLGIE